MTPVPVVSATLTTRTQRRWELQVDDPKTRFLTKTWKADGPWVEDSMHLGVRTGVSTTVRRVRERLTVDPVFVPLPEAPDLTCRECWNGTGLTMMMIGEDDWVSKPCKPCGGSGVTPVYAATWQTVDMPLDPHEHLGPMIYEHSDGRREPIPRPSPTVNDLFVARRQVVEWRATDVTVLPVVDKHMWAAGKVADGEAVHLMGGTSWHVVIVNGRTQTVIADVTAEPWAADLRHGQFVLRLDGWEHLEQPHTEMTVGGFIDGRAIGPVRVPLSVPDGILSWINLV